MKYLIMFILQIVSTTAFAGNKTYFGHVRDAGTGEVMIGAIITVKNHQQIGTVTNEYGFYSITVNEEDNTLIATFVGYTPTQINVANGSPAKQDITISTASVLKEVTIKANNPKTLSDAQMGVEKLNISDIKAIPVLFGEKDILKTLQLLPGVKSAGDGNSGFYVRGGGADQNLVLLDEAIVYNPSHLMGFFSTFNSDAVKDVTLYKCAMPAQYGGRLSSVEDVRMNDGNSKEYHVSGGVGIIASRLNIEGPIGSDKGSFLIAGRRSYADALMNLWDGNDMGRKLYFYDLNLKTSYRLGDKDRIFLSGYFGKDKLGLGSDFGLDWSNKTSTLRWNHLLSSKVFSNTSIIYSDYNYLININPGMGEFEMRSQIRDWNFKEEISIYSSNRTSYKFGLNAIYHTVTPGEITNKSAGFKFALQDRRSVESALYFSGHLKANSTLSVDYGIRLAAFAALGSGDYYNLDKNKNILDTVTYKSGQIAHAYTVPEPRLSVSQMLSSNTSLKLSYARNSQFLHLISNATSANPTDKWISSNNSIKPGISDQYGG